MQQCDIKSYTVTLQHLNDLLMHPYGKQSKEGGWMESKGKDKGENVKGNDTGEDMRSVVR